MLFNSIEFIIFLPIVFILYWFVFRQTKWQNIFIVIASYIFYGWWNWKFLSLILFTSLCSFYSGILIEKYRYIKSTSKFVLIINLILNLGILSIFKYFNFFIGNLQIIFDAIGINLDWTTINIILPVGISFYTFQAISYAIDVYRNNLKPTKNVIAFCAYISFFPQLVAGPIERATNLLPQFLKKRRFSYPLAVDGCRQILWGFLKKMVIADNCAETVDRIWNDYNHQVGPVLIIGAILFAIQIYCDFSGYSDIAIGSAKLFGIKLSQNFRYSYFSRNITEFWRRWHMSLMSWFKDYVYIPLGGNRCSKWKHLRNVFFVFGLSGLWHGPNLTYLCWGFYHAILFIPFILWGWKSKLPLKQGCGTFLQNMKEACQIITTFCFVAFGFIIFRAKSITQAFSYISGIFSYGSINFTTFHGKKTIIYCILFFLVEWIQRDKEHALQFSNNTVFKYRIFRWTVYYLIFAVIIAFSAIQQNFIYFQF